MTSRLHQLREQYASLNIDAFLVTFQPHLRYLSGFSGSSGIGLVTPRSAFLITDSRYTDQVRQETRRWKCYISKNGLFEELRARRLIPASMRIGFDGNTVVLSQYRLLKKLLPRAAFLPKVDCIEKLAAVKDPLEIASIRRAVSISDRVFGEIIALIKPGITELDVAAEISYRQKRLGAEGDAFETIVASGERSALPHGRASSKKLERGDLVTLDFGCVVNGYHSDMTRTIVLGRPKAEVKKIYTTVLEAQEKAIGAATSGMRTCDLDAVARTHISRCGYEAFFRHSLGHGLGLQIHEAPRISVRSTATLQAGNVITIEPGIYLPRLGGVRIEDDIVVTNDGCEVLNRSTKELLVV